MRRASDHRGHAPVDQNYPICPLPARAEACQDLSVDHGVRRFEIPSTALWQTGQDSPPNQRVASQIGRHDKQISPSSEPRPPTMWPGKSERSIRNKLRGLLFGELLHYLPEGCIVSTTDQRRGAGVHPQMNYGLPRFMQRPQASVSSACLCMFDFRGVECCFGGDRAPEPARTDRRNSSSLATSAVCPELDNGSEFLIRKALRGQVREIHHSSDRGRML